MADEVESFSVVVQSQSFSCCGTILDLEAGYIITVGSIVKGLWHQTDNHVRENVGMSRKYVSQVQERDIPVDVILKRTSQKNASLKDFITLDGKVVASWRDEKLEEICKSMFPSMEWTFEEGASTEGRNDERSQGGRNSPLFLADFALIKVENLSAYLFSKSSLNIKENAVVGETITIVGTPFGSECSSIFFNSVSQGIVSKVIGSNTEMILTDARCVPGCEGCPVFVGSVPGNASSIYGIVIVPFCWRSGEWIGLTLVCSIKHILKTLLQTDIQTKTLPLKNLMERSLSINEKTVVANPNDPLCTDLNNNNNQENTIHSLKNRNQESHIADVLKKSRPCVVLIQCGTTWGSGIVTDSDNGLVITCRHILTEGGLLKSKGTSQHYSNMGKPLVIHDVLAHSVYNHVEIVFATSQDCALDFALLKVKNHNFKASVKFREGYPYSDVFRKGEDVLAIGYSLFGSDLSNGPCITSGTLSNVTYISGIPAMLQSSAAVHCGGSGGAIVSSDTGELLGMVTCNTRDANSSSSFPHINFSIPSNLILRLTALSLSVAKTRRVYLMDLVSSVEDAWHLNSNRNSKSKL